MKNIFFFIIICITTGCISAPKNFTYYYEDIYTGLDTIIDINGYYVSQHECDSSFFSVYMFYPNGLFTIATTSHVSSDLLKCFLQGGNDIVCKYPLWGTYRIKNDTIKTQTIRMEGNGCVIFRDYKILPDKSIVNISDYVEPQYTILGYMQNYPSFKENRCEKKANFYPMLTKRDFTECPFLKKKWFNIKNKNLSIK